MAWTYDEYGNEVWEEDEPAPAPERKEKWEEGWELQGDNPPYDPESPTPPAAETPTGGGGLPPGRTEASFREEMKRHLGASAETMPLADLIAAFNRAQPGTRTSTDGTGGGNPPGILTGYDNFLMQQAMLNSQAAIQLGQAQLEEQRQRRINVDMPTMENNRRYQEAQIRLKEAEETFRRELDRIKFEFEKEKFGRTQGEVERQFDTGTAMDIWGKQQTQAQDRAALTGAYAAPPANPTLPGYSVRQMFDKDVESYLGRKPTLEEYQQWLMWGSQTNEPRPARPQDRLGPLSGMPQPLTGVNKPSPSPAPGVSGGLTREQVRAAVEAKIGRGMTDAEYRSWESGRFDPQHPHVVSGQAQAGQPLGPEYAREWDTYRAQLPEAWRQYYEENTGQKAGSYEAPKPKAQAAATYNPLDVLPSGSAESEEERKRKLRQAALTAA